jgi:hypothetical protein
MGFAIYRGWDDWTFGPKYAVLEHRDKDDPAEPAAPIQEVVNDERRPVGSKPNSTDDAPRQPTPEPSASEIQHVAVQQAQARPSAHLSSEMRVRTLGSAEFLS